MNMRIWLTCLGYFTLRVEVSMGWNLDGILLMAVLIEIS